MDRTALWRRLLAEWLGSGLLAAVVIGSGIAAQQLTPGDTGLELLYNSAATGAGLFALILMLGPVSGAHFNPAVSVVDAAFGGMRWRDALAYAAAQIAGCACGAVLANVMFHRAAVSISTHHRATGAHFVSEIVATAGLLLVIFALARTGRGSSAPAAVGAYIGAAYWFTSSTSFANPAITVGRVFSNSFAGIAPASVPPFIAAQILGAVLGFGAIKLLYPRITPGEASRVVLPHETSDGRLPASYPGHVSGQPVPGGVVHELPADLRDALIANPAALDAWADITPLARNEFICWVDDAKKQMTRERRIRRTQEELEEGQRRPCCWPGCGHRERTGK